MNRLYCILSRLYCDSFLYNKLTLPVVSFKNEVKHLYETYNVIDPHKFYELLYETCMLKKYDIIPNSYKRSIIENTIGRNK